MDFVILVGGVIIFSLIIGYSFYSIWRKILIFKSSKISREIQGLSELPRPPLKDLVSLLEFLILKRGEIEKTIEKQEMEDKYNNTYQ